MDQSGAGSGDAIIIIVLILVALVGTVILMEDAVSQAFDNFWPG
jgi:Flp pilus assembly pilin Flp